jgi:membrane protease YdiL (CAAX protease family)
VLGGVAFAFVIKDNVFWSIPYTLRGLIGTIYLTVVAVLATMAMAETGRSWLSYGYSRVSHTNWERLLGLGAMYGFVAFGLGGLLLLVFGVFRISGFAISGSEWLYYPAATLTLFALTGFTEELIFRGYILQTLAPVIRFWPAAAITALIFGALHTLTSTDPLYLTGVILFSLFASFTLKRTGTLWFAAGFHFAVDFTQSFIWGTGGWHLFKLGFPNPTWIGEDGFTNLKSYLLLFGVVFAWIVLARAQPLWATITRLVRSVADTLNGVLPEDRDV